MSFHIEMDEIYQARDRYLKMAEQAQKELSGAKTSLNNIISSKSIYGSVGEAITNEINHIHVPVAMGLDDSLDLLGSEYSQTIQDFQTTTGETDTKAILDGSTLTHLQEQFSQKELDHGAIMADMQSTYYSISDLISLKVPSSAEYYTKSSTLKTHLQSIQTNVGAFEMANPDSSTEMLLNLIGQQLDSAKQTRMMDYEDIRLSDFVARDDFSKAIKQIDNQIKEAKKIARLQANQEAKKKKDEWAKNHPIQSAISTVSDTVGSWWEKVIEGTKGLPIPVVREALLTMEGVLLGAGKMVSTVAIGVVDLGQLAVSGLEIASDCLSGQESPQWMLEDWQGTIDNGLALGRLALGAVVANSPLTVFEFVIPEVHEMAENSRNVASQIGNQILKDLTSGDFSIYGQYIFEIASLFIGGAEIKGALNSTKLGSKALEKISQFKNLTRATLLEQASQIGAKIEHLLQYGDDAIKALTNKFLDTPFQWGDELALANGTTAKTTTTLREFFKERGVMFSEAGETSHKVIKVNNMNEFFQTEFGRKLKQSLRKTSRKYQGQTVYEVVDKGIDGLKKGDLVYLDGLHKDHLEVFNKRGELKTILNLDGSVNNTKYDVGIGRNIRK